MPYKDPNCLAAKESRKRRYKKWATSEKGKKVKRRIQLKYYYGHQGERKKYNDKYTQIHKDAWKIHRKEQRWLVLIHYGGNPPKCACCDETRYEFLTIDHINGGGKQHLKKIGWHIARWLIKNNYPSGFRVLCLNCNFAFGHYGYCPHSGKTELIPVKFCNMDPKDLNSS